jgi:hypothetical protein
VAPKKIHGVGMLAARRRCRFRMMERLMSDTTIHLLRENADEHLP